MIVDRKFDTFRSFTLTSLSFFRSLTKIDVQNATSTLKGNDELSDEYIRPYGLEIYENDNLQTLFNWKEKQHFEIIGGGMFIHYNSKLCMSEVHNLQSITDYDRSHDSLGYNTNGYDETCHATGGFLHSLPVCVSVQRTRVLPCRNVRFRYRQFAQ